MAFELTSLEVEVRVGAVVVDDMDDAHSLVAGYIKLDTLMWNIGFNTCKFAAHDYFLARGWRGKCLSRRDAELCREEGVSVSAQLCGPAVSAVLRSLCVPASLRSLRLSAFLRGDEGARRYSPPFSGEG